MARLNIKEIYNCSECEYNIYNEEAGQQCSKGCKDWSPRYCPDTCPLPEANDVVLTLLKERSKMTEQQIAEIIKTSGLSIARGCDVCTDMNCKLCEENERDIINKCAKAISAEIKPKEEVK